jgi:hypothetical protein
MAHRGFWFGVAGVTAAIVVVGAVVVPKQR